MTSDVVEECVHGLGPVTACVICNGRAAREYQEQDLAPVIFPARYTGQCVGCNLPISLGDLIAWREDRRATHADCWEARHDR